MLTPKVSVITTADGSSTLFHEEVGEHYHSINGAFQESLHVFVQNGFSYYHELSPLKNISILEVGFGTGLNFLLSMEFAIQHKIALKYVGLETYPLPLAVLTSTKYEDLLQDENTWNNYINIYSEAYQTNVELGNNIQLKVEEIELLKFDTNEQFDIIYFDAFAKAHQSEMWTEESIAKACSFLKDKGIFVTYSVTGDLKRTLKGLGFEIERPAGAAGKREMMRATFNQNNAL